MSSTTQYMIKQANSSLKLMRSNYQDRNRFIREFQHFISEARSIIDYLKNEYSYKIGSEEFIKAYKRDLYSNAFGRFFIDARNFSIHEKPMQIIVKDVDSKGKHSNYCHIDFDDYEPKTDLYFDPKTAKVDKYYFSEYPNTEVIDCCEKYLNQIISLTKTCELIFGSP